VVRVELWLAIGGVLERPAVLEMSGNAGRPERAANLGLDARRDGSPSYDGMRVSLVKYRAAQLLGTAADCAKQRPFRIVMDPCRDQARVQILF
jgi:hypothetical protein